ncbi:hypothetical protein P171DRAFT_490024 [Karstenula rhodostoma CBS 690.94]|uniref:Uncharacterized protein n=1 Tax=Karstenula rhodostoma CBS 690.94 TaxID=1392251 RepID=A0A9P4P6K3_9PLEO|nr:hypothetical protein P171DRAFT_490024 [Karstenula rhodostoma CBS 690.94]
MSGGTKESDKIGHRKQLWLYCSVPATASYHQILTLTVVFLADLYLHRYLLLPSFHQFRLRFTLRGTENARTIMGRKERGQFNQDQQQNNRNLQHWKANRRGKPNQNNPGNQGVTRQWSSQNPNQKYKHKKKPPNHQFDEQQDHHPSRNQVHKTIQCERCEKTGHSENFCTAKETPIGSRCPCGNEFHYQNQCPYEGDMFKRDDKKARKEGKFCTWCKDTGDGRHTFDECSKAIEFRLDIRRIQRDAYDDLDFCWHCRNVDHKTKACTGAQAQLDKDLWAAKISEVMEEWKKYSNVALRTAYFDDQWDQQMSDVKDRRLPPLAAHYRWCIMCEVFGHATGEKIGGCDTAKFDSRCPAERRIQVASARPFVPSGFQASSAQANNVLMPRGPRQDYTVCSAVGCNKMLGPWTWPMPPLGQSIFCPNCTTSQYHPDYHHQPYQLGQLGMVKDIKNFIETVVGATTGGDKARARARLHPELQAMYDKRPSLKLQWSLAHRQKLGFVGTHDAHPYRYTDGSRQGAWSPVMWEDGRYFNADWQGGGNYQEYFPAITFQITPRMWVDVENDALPINRVGRQGLIPKCTGCHAPILVLDDEDDVVMCDTAWTNTLGEGTGKGFYRRADGTYDPHQCECLWMIGQRGVVGWENGRTGEWAV